MKKIEDYLHLYLGCECDLHINGKPQGVIGVLEKVGKQDTYIIGSYRTAILSNHFAENYMPLLRPLTDMTEEEKEYCGFALTAPPQYYINEECFSFDQVRYLLSKHFDLFGLIEAGLAIDKTTLK